jgi:hypothetical protein
VFMWRMLQDLESVAAAGPDLEEGLTVRADVVAPARRHRAWADGDLVGCAGDRHVRGALLGSRSGAVVSVRLTLGPHSHIGCETKTPPGAESVRGSRDITARLLERRGAPAGDTTENDANEQPDRGADQKAAGSTQDRSKHRPQDVQLGVVAFVVRGSRSRSWRRTSSEASISRETALGKPRT